MDNNKQDEKKRAKQKSDDGITNWFTRTITGSTAGPVTRSISRHNTRSTRSMTASRGKQATTVVGATSISQYHLAALHRKRAASASPQARVQKKRQQEQTVNSTDSTNDSAAVAATSPPEAPATETTPTKTTPAETTPTEIPPSEIELTETETAEKDDENDCHGLPSAQSCVANHHDTQNHNPVGTSSLPPSPLADTTEPTPVEVTETETTTTTSETSETALTEISPTKTDIPASHDANDSHDLRLGKSLSLSPPPAAATIEAAETRKPINDDENDCQSMPSKRLRKTINRGFMVETTSPVRRSQSQRQNKKTMETLKPANKEKNKNQTISSQFANFNWICMECKEADCMADLDSDLLLCDGCHRPFHVHCILQSQQHHYQKHPATASSTTPKTMTQQDLLQLDEWICHDCTVGRHACSVCQEYGQDDVDVYRCSRYHDCGRFFHESCLANYNVTITHVPKKKLQPLVASKDEGKKEQFQREASKKEEEQPLSKAHPPAVAVAKKQEIATTSNIGKDSTKCDPQVNDKEISGTKEKRVETGDQETENLASNPEQALTEDEQQQHVEMRPVFRCPAHQCWTCTEEFAVEDDEEGEEKNKFGGSSTKSTANNQPQKMKRSKKRKRRSSSSIYAQKSGFLVHCMECPIAYHLSCIPPTAQFHELALLCHDHAGTCKLPDLDMKVAFQGEVEADADQRLEDLLQQKSLRRPSKKKSTTATTVATTSSFMDRKQPQQPLLDLRVRRRLASQGDGRNNVFFLGLQGDVISKAEHKLLQHVEGQKKRGSLEPQETNHDGLFQMENMMFCLPIEYKEEVYAKPPPFRFIHSLRYNHNKDRNGYKKIKRHPPSGEACNCHARNGSYGDGACDETCHNRIIGIECVGDEEEISKRIRNNSYWNCKNGPNCGNRVMGQRKVAKCKPVREQGRGWGLVPLHNIKQGDLVQEYVGQVIDEETKDQRLQEWSIEHPNDFNFYIMELEKGWYIDARHEANLSRFINHSCDPNCHLRRINVAGYMRIGIFAVRDVMAGEFLSYDYQFDTKHGDKFICRCGAANCRGTMKGGRQKQEQQQQQTPQQVASSQQWQQQQEQQRKKQKQCKDGGDLLEPNHSLQLSQANEASRDRNVKPSSSFWKQDYDRQVKYLQEVDRVEQSKYSLIDQTVPSFQFSDELVANGPRKKRSQLGITNRVFLWRNVMAGSDFAARHERRRRRQQQSRGGKTQKHDDSAPVNVLSLFEKSNKNKKKQTKKSKGRK